MDSSAWVIVILLYIAFIVVIIKALRSSYSGRPHSHSVSRESYETRLGREGETAVASYLGRLSPADYHVYNDVLFCLGNYSVQIDHIVLSRYGIFVVETKNYHGRIYGSDNQEQWSEYFPGRYHTSQEYKFYNPLWQNSNHIRALRQILNSDFIPIYGIVVFPPGTVIEVYSAFPVLTWDFLFEYILSHSKPIISDDVIETVKSILNGAIDTRPEDRMIHLENVHRMKQMRNASTSASSLE